MVELWLPYPEISKYEVSTHGNVRVFHGGHNKWQMKSQRSDKDGYKTVSITDDNGKESTRRVHRMVAATFIPNPSNCPVVHHKDNVKWNNHVSNLEWTTISFNTKHAYHVNALRSPSAKYVKASIDGELFSYYDSCARCADSFGSSRRYIEDIVKDGGLYKGTIKLEEVVSLPEKALKDKRIPNGRHISRNLNPYKIVIDGEELYFACIKDFAEYFGITFGQAQWALNKKKSYKGNPTEKVSDREYMEQVLVRL